ncbi:DUF447 family protein [Candidatus Bathyarchaeota archaeon]|nr:MAG: DUF447 family protein [Candidatus Bathyarchaeota archaeon]
MHLRNLGFSKLTYSEVILTIRYEDIVNIAPIGVLLEDDKHLSLRVYKGQRICELISKGAIDCVLNITRNPKLFYDAIFNKNAIPHHPSETVSSPRVEGCDAYVECSIVHVEDHREYVRVLLKPQLTKTYPRIARTYNRAEPAVIEALICFTKIIHLIENNLEAAESLKERIKIFREIVHHSTRNEKLRMMITEILERSEKMIRENTAVNKH